MRVCVDLTPLEMLDRHGGFGRYALYLLRELAGLAEQDGGFELSAVLSSLGPVLPAREALAAASALGPEIASGRHRMQRRLALGVSLRRAGIDVFHATQPRAMPWLAGCRLVATAHDLIPVVLPRSEGAGARAGAAWMRRVHGLRYRRADEVIAISELTRRDLVRELGIDASRISVIHHGVDPARFHADAPAGEAAETRRRYGLPERWLLCVGSDHYRKNHRRLVEAWCQVADRIPDGLVVVGRPLYEHTLPEVDREVRSRGLTDRFRWLEAVNDDELPALYRGATAYVAPSLYEGFGMTLLEAMACGTPVVAARNGAFEEVGAEAARYFDPLRSEDLAERLLQVASDEALRRELVGQGHTRAAQLSWRATAVATLAVYRRAYAGA